MYSIQAERGEKTARPHVMPTGHIDRPTEGAAAFILNNAGDSKGLRINTPMDARDR